MARPTRGKLMKCPACGNRPRQAAITCCGHTFCALCVDALKAAPDPKCPSCGRHFNQTDVLVVNWT
jgi:hypothetical protein